MSFLFSPMPVQLLAVSSDSSDKESQGIAIVGQRMVIRLRLEEEEKSRKEGVDS